MLTNSAADRRLKMWGRDIVVQKPAAKNKHDTASKHGTIFFEFASFSFGYEGSNDK